MDLSGVFVGVCGGAFVYTYERGHAFDISPTNVGAHTHKTKDVLGFFFLGGGRAPYSSNLHIE